MDFTSTQSGRAGVSPRFVGDSASCRKGHRYPNGAHFWRSPGWWIPTHGAISSERFWRSGPKRPDLLRNIAKDESLRWQPAISVVLLANSLRHEFKDAKGANASCEERRRSLPGRILDQLRTGPRTVPRTGRSPGGDFQVARPGGEVFTAAVALRPGSPEARNGLAAALLAANAPESIVQLHEAIRARAQFRLRAQQSRHSIASRREAQRGRRRVPRGDPPQTGLCCRPLQSG